MKKVEFYIWMTNGQKMVDLVRLLAPMEYHKDQICRNKSLSYFDLDDDDDLKKHIDICKFRSLEGTPAFRFFSGIPPSPDFRSPLFKVGENGRAIYACIESDEAMDSFKEIIRTGLMDGCIIRSRGDDEGVAINRLYFVNAGVWVLLCDMALSGMVDMCENRA